jgi:hypothetical protein
LLFFPYCHGEIHISERIASHDKLAPCTRGGGSGGDVGRWKGVCTCAPQ